MARAAKSSSFETLPLAGKIGLMLMLLATVSAIYYFALHMGIVEEIEAADQQHARLERSLLEAQERQREYLRLTQELAEREPIDRRNKRILPEQAEIAAFLQDINREAELNGLNIKLVEPRPEETQPHFVKIPVNLQVTGRFHQLAKFFYSVSRTERAVSMEDIQLTNPTVDDSDEVTLTVSTLATTYRRPSTPAPGAPAGGPGSGGGGPGGGMR